MLYDIWPALVFLPLIFFWPVLALFVRFWASDTFHSLPAVTYAVGRIIGRMLKGA